MLSSLGGLLCLPSIKYLSCLLSKSAGLHLFPPENTKLFSLKMSFLTTSWIPGDFSVASWQYFLQWRVTSKAETSSHFYLSPQICRIETGIVNVQYVINPYSNRHHYKNVTQYDYSKGPNNNIAYHSQNIFHSLLNQREKGNWSLLLTYCHIRRKQEEEKI